MLKKLFITFVISILLVSCNQTNSDENLVENSNENLISNDINEDVIIRGKIVDIYENLVLICGVEEENSINTLITIEADSLPEDATFGSIIDLHFNDSLSIMESYPAQLSKIDKIEIVRNDNDILGLFIQLINEIYARNENLIETNNIAFALITDDILTKGEEDALIYITGTQINDEILYNVYEKEVNDNNIIYDNDNEVLFFIDSQQNETGYIFDIGILLPVAVEEYEGDFILNDWYSNCQIIIKDDGFDYIHGTENNELF